jgi:hypothetical protein
LTSDKVEYLPRDTPPEGRGKVSVKKKEILMQCEPRSGGDCLDFTQSLIAPARYPV